MDNFKDICIICEDKLLGRYSCSYFDSIVPEDELRDLKLFLCKELSIPLSCFEYCGFPFCQKCTTTKVKELMRIHNQLLALHISYSSLKQTLLHDIVTVYVRKNSPLDHMNSSDKGPTNVIIKKWRDYIAHSGLSSSNDSETSQTKNEFVDLSELEIKEEFCELSENSICFEETNYFEEHELDEPPTSDKDQTFPAEYTNESNFDSEDISNAAVIINARKRKTRTKRLNYCEIVRNMSSFKEDVKKIKSRKNKKRTKIKVTSSKAKVLNVNNQGKVKTRFVRKLQKCPLCAREMRGSDRLRIHMRIHTNERPYVCSECNKAFRQFPHLQTHKKMRHGYQGKTKTAEGLNEIASKNRIYHCAFCSTTRKNKGLYLRHLMYVHVGKEVHEGHSVSFYYCDAKECAVACADQEQLKNHFVQCHEDLLPEGCSDFPQCDICQRVFTIQANLKIHKCGHPSVNNEDQSTFPCDYCYQVFKSEAEMNDHLPRHKIPCCFSKIFSYLCDLCGKSFKDSPALKYHKRQAHRQDHSQKEKENTAKSRRASRIYFCALCDNQLKSKRSFVLHLKSLHPQEINDGDTFWFHHCDAQECLASFTKEEGLKKHFEESHKTLLSTNSFEFPKCDTCQRVFALQENVDIHKTCHNSEPPLVFGCEYCQECFSSKSDLNKHSYDHKFKFECPEKESLHLCEFCGYGFTKVLALSQHVKKIHEENKRKCPVCEKVLLATSMSNHMLKHNSSRVFSCPHCPHVASNSISLQLHLEKIHPSNNSPAKLLTNNCQYCEKCFYMPSEVHKHSIIHHATEYLNGKSFCCSCYKTFKTEEEMEKHFKAQHPHLICSVEECRKKFHNPTRLSLHMNIHKKEKPFICEYCQRGFAQDTALQFHINTKHTFHRSFLCKLCPDNPGYYERRTFNKHLESDHPTFAHKDILITNYPKRKYFF